MSESFLENLHWRHATKKFDKDSVVNDEQLNRIKDAIHLAPSSFGLQPFYVVDVRDEAIKQRLQTAGWNQPQFTTATSVFVFVSRADTEQRISEMEQELTRINPNDASIPGRTKMMRGFVANMSSDDKLTWAQRQAYIALGFAMAACAELKLDSCPMEGFSPKDFDRILNLPTDHNATVALTIGKRDPSVGLFPKFRFPFQSIVQTLVLALFFGGCQIARETTTDSSVYGTDSPKLSGIAASTIYNNHKHNIVTIWHPAPLNAMKGKYVDAHNLGKFGPLPSRFLIGDGLLTRAFVMIDTRPGSPLLLILDKMLKNRSSKSLVEIAGSKLTTLTGNRWTEGVNEAGDNIWDPKNFKVEGEDQEFFEASASLAVGHPPVESSMKFPIVPFERFLDCEKCSAYCIHKVLLTKLLFDRAGIKSRMVTGALINQSIEFGPFTTDGHSWIEIPSDKTPEGFEIIDPTWGKRGFPEKRNSIDKNWVMFSKQYRVANQRYPILQITSP